MRPSSRCGVLSRALITLMLAGLLVVELPLGPPVTSGGWPGLEQAWHAVLDLMRPDAAAAEPAGAPAPRHGPPAPPPPPTRVREVAERRTAHTRVFAMSDGSFEAELSSSPVSYQDGHGRWQPVDTAVRPGGRDGFRFSNDTNAFRSSFGDRTDRLVRFELGDRQVTLGLDGPVRPAEPTTDGGTVRYPGVLDSAELVYDVTGESLKEKILLARSPTDPTYRTLRCGEVEPWNQCPAADRGSQPAHFRSGQEPGTGDGRETVLRRITARGEDCADASGFVALSGTLVFLREKGKNLSPEERRAITMVKNAADDELAKGWQSIFDQLGQQDQKNFQNHIKEGRYFRAYQVLGKAFHIAVWNNLQANNPGEFTHDPNKGVDFRHKSGFNVELSTVSGYFKWKLGKGGEYLKAGYVLLNKFPNGTVVRGLGGGSARGSGR